MTETVRTFKHFHIDLVERKPATNVYNVLTNKKVPYESGVILEGYELLAKILWSPPWRQYVVRFVASDYDTDMSINCLQDMMDFTQELMNERKRKKEEKMKKC